MKNAKPSNQCNDTTKYWIKDEKNSYIEWQNKTIKPMIQPNNGPILEKQQPSTTKTYRVVWITTKQATTVWYNQILNQL